MICNLFSDPAYWFFTSDVPQLLYYSHIPSASIALLLGFYVFFKGRTLLLNKLLLAISITFFLFTLDNLALWTKVQSDLLLFGWSILPVFSILILLFCVYFSQVYLSNKDITLSNKALLLGLTLPLFFLVPTSMNISGFDITQCDGFMFQGQLFNILYFVYAIIAMSWILFLLVKNFHLGNKERRMQIVLFGVGIEFFLFSFFTINFLADYLMMKGVLYDSRIEFISFLGMVVFMTLIAVLIVRYKAFSVKIFATQALVVALWILVGSLLLVVETDISRIITSITFLLSVLFGIALIRSVRREIEARELLAIANRGQEHFIHFLSHEVKGYLTVARNGYSAIALGEFGPVSEETVRESRTALERMNEGVTTVENILRSANLKSGKVTFAFAPFDLGMVIAEQAEKARHIAEERGLALLVHVPSGEHVFVGDRENVAEHVVRNLIENALFYTQKGTVTVRLEKTQSQHVFSVTDTGVGISSDDKKRLFTEGGRGVEALRYNVHSTGHGLFIAKCIVEAHKGEISAESDGVGKGSVFTVTFPISTGGGK